MEFIKHCPGDLLEDAEHPHAAQGHVYCLIYRKDSHKANQPQVSAAAASILLLRYPMAATGQSQPWQQMWKNSHWPSSRISPPSDALGTGRDHQLDWLAISYLPGGSWAELIELKVTTNSPCLALLSPHSLVEQLIVFNCHYSEYQWS